jgi:hypothetical protein
LAYWFWCSGFSTRTPPLMSIDNFLKYFEYKGHETDGA